MKSFRKITALLLSLVMVLSLLPTGAFALEGEEAEPINPEPNYGLINQYHVGTQAVTDAYRRGESLEINGVTVGQPVRDLPSSWDSRNQGWITSVKNQNPYGSCWAHAALGGVEAYMIKNGVPVGTGAAATTSLNLSETQHCYFNYSSAYDAEGMTNGDKCTLTGGDSCLDTGGNGEMSAYTLQHWTGAADESVSALTYSKASTVASSGLGSQYAYQYNVSHVQNSEWIPGDNIDAIKEAIMKYGAGNISYYAGGSYSTYDYEYQCTIDTTSQDSASHKWANHAITLVGWDDTIAASNFKPNRPSSPGAWLCKNSWGTSYFGDGYMWISYEDTSASEGYIYFYDAEPIDNYAHNYQYDGTCNPVCYGKGWPSGEDYYVGFENNTKVANVFTAKGSEVLKAVALCNWDEALSYTVEIYKNPSTGNPSSGTLMSTQNGYLEFSGYYTIPLDSPVSLAAGDSFSVVVTQNVPVADDEGNYVHTPYDATFKNTDVVEWANWTHVNHGNTSYYKEPNGSWTDCPDNGDYRIKAFTDDYVEDPVPVSMELIALGQVVGTLEGTAGQTVVTLPDTAPEAEGWSFIGWISAELDETNSKPLFYERGASFVMTSTVPVLYALYTRVEINNNPEYRIVTDPSQLSLDASVIITANGTSNYSLSKTQNTNNRSAVEGTKSSDGSTFLPNAQTAILKLGEGTADGTWSFYDDSNGGYLYAASSSSNYLRTETTLNANGSWEITISDNEATVKAQGSNTRNLLRYNNSSKLFSCYASGQQGVYLYQRESDITFYATNPAIDVHVHTLTYVPEVESTCVEQGHSAYWYCEECGKYFSDEAGENEISLISTVLPLAEHTPGTIWGSDEMKHWHICVVCGASMEDKEDHVWDDGSVTTPPTPAEPGEKTYTCEICQYARTEAIPALGYDYTLKFSVLGDETVIEPMICNSVTGVILPVAEGPEGYSFLGWVRQNYDCTATRPEEVLYGQYAAQGDELLYALFSYNPGGGSAEPALVLLGENDVPAVGDRIVIRAYDTEYALYQETINNSYVNNYIFTDDVNAVASDAKKWLTVNEGAAENAWTLGDAENGYLYSSGSNNLAVSSSATDFVLGKVLNEDNSFLGFTLKTTTGRYLSCRTDLTGGNANLWRLGGANASTGTSTLMLYALREGGDDTVYTTVLAGSCEHSFGEWTTNEDGTHSRSCALCGITETEDCVYTDTVVPPTAAEQGCTIHTCEICGYSFKDSFTDPLGYDYTVTFSVFGDLTLIEPMISNTNTGIILPDAAAPEGYSFAGWVTEEYDNVETMPAVILRGAYTASADITLLALFSRLEGSGGSTAWVSVAAEDVTEGRYLIAAVVSETEQNIYHFADGSVNNDMGVTEDAAYAVDGRIALDLVPGNAAIFNFAGNNSDGFAISPDDGGYLGYSAESNRRLALSEDYSGVLWQAAEKEGLNENGLFLKCTTGTYAISQNSYNYASAIRGYASGTAYTPIYLFKETETGVSVYTTVLSEEIPFEDVEEGTYYYDAVRWAFFNDPQITKGTDDTHFSPDMTCSRAQVVTFLYRAAGSPEVTGSVSFSDVSASAWYYDAVRWAVENNITSGTSAETFSPNQPCTRAQAVTFLYRFAGSPEVTGSNPFQDVAEGAWYYDAVLWAAQNNITTGTGASAFSPSTIVSRAQVVTFLYRWSLMNRE